MRSKKALRNILFSFAVQAVTFLTGFLIPRFIMRAYGSAVNGAIESINYFLGFISLFESGVGSVIIAAMYKPLAEKDGASLDGILAASDRFFKRIAYIFIGYVALLAVCYPFFVPGTLTSDFFYFMVPILALSSFSQYYFGMTNSLLLQADHKINITAIAQICTALLNFALTVSLISAGMSIHIVKLLSMTVFILRPIVIRTYIHRHYAINRRAVPDTRLLSQRFVGIAQHIAHYVHTATDTVIVTLFLGATAVSVYGSYNKVVLAIGLVLTAFSAALKSFMGDMFARGETDTLKNTLSLYEFINYTAVSVLFVCVHILIVPFVMIYTSGITDANYFQPAFATILVLAEVFGNLRLPYSTLCMAAGKFRETRTPAMMEAGINIVLSLLLITRYGLVGIAFGTLCAMIFRFIHFVVLVRKKILSLPLLPTVFRLTANAAGCVIVLLLSNAINLSTGSFQAWLFAALVTFVIAMLVIVPINTLLFRADVRLIRQIGRRLIRSNGKDA